MAGPGENRTRGGDGSGGGLTKTQKVDSDPRTACGIETGFKCAGFYNGQCAMPDASFRDRDAFAGNLAYCPGQATLVEELPPTGTITAFADSWAWDLEGCLRAEATYVDTGCYALVTEVVDEVRTTTTQHARPRREGRGD